MDDPSYKSSYEEPGEFQSWVPISAAGSSLLEGSYHDCIVAASGLNDHLKGVWDGCVVHVHVVIIVAPQQETPCEGESVCE